jgi:hypothetical protein
MQSTVELRELHNKFIKLSKPNIIFLLIPFIGFFYATMKSGFSLVKLSKDQAIESYVESEVGKEMQNAQENVANKSQQMISPRMKNIGIYVAMYNSHFSKYFLRFMFWGLIVSIYFALAFPWLLQILVIRNAKIAIEKDIKSIEEKIEKAKKEIII